MSPDARYVVFESSETVLVEPASNGQKQIFLRDRKLAKTEIISVDSAGAIGNKPSSRPSISDDGCLVAFQSDADNLVASDANTSADVFVRDRCKAPATTTLVSVDPSGLPLAHSSANPMISGDGQWVAFDNDSGGTGDIYLYNRTTKASQRLTHGNYGSRSPAISRDGSRIVFWSYASDLVTGDTNGLWDIFLYDTKATTPLSIVTTTAAGVQQTKGNEGTSTIAEPAISADGKFAAFRSRTDNLASTATGQFSQLYVKNLTNGEIKLASVSTAGALGDADSSGSGSGIRPSLSSDGAWVAFQSSATNLATETGGNSPNAYLHNNATGETVGFTTSTSDDPPVVSADACGRFVAMFSTGKLDSRFGENGIFVIDRYFH